MNKALVVLVIVVFLGVGALLFNSGESPKTSNTNKPKQVPVQVEEEVVELAKDEQDSYANTIKVMNARSLEEKKRNDILEKRLKELEENRLKEEQVKTIVNRSTDERSRDLSKTFKEKFKELRGDFDEKLNVKGMAEMPDGLGFDNLGTGKLSNMFNGKRKHSRNGVIASNENIVTILPMTTPSLGGQNKEQTLAIDGSPLPKGSSNKSVRFSKGAKKGTKSDKPELIPFYTINQNATMMANTTMTALVGIVPNEQGSVVDPIRFKIITGNNNIASNGLYIPGVKNIVWSGIAIGNREMSCVRGELHSVTFTFEDGTIRTINSQSDSGKDKLGGKMLGYIATPNGNPCMPGLLVTNAEDYLKDRMWASGFAAAADGFSQTQLSSQVTDSGSVNQFFTGDTADFVAANMLKGTLTELTDYLRARQRQAVDLVFLAGGKDVVVHVETQLAIDYDPTGRKLDHANQLPTSFASYQLD